MRKGELIEEIERLKKLAYDPRQMPVMRAWFKRRLWFAARRLTNYQMGRKQRIPA